MFRGRSGRTFQGTFTVLSLLAVCLITGSTLLVGCGGGGLGSSPTQATSSNLPGVSASTSNTPPTILTTITAKQDDKGNVQYFHESGAPMSPAQLRQTLMNMPKDESKGIALKIDLPPPPGANEKNDPRWGAAVPFTCYYIVINWHKHFLGGCIRRDVWHLNFLVNNRCNGQLIFDSHMCSWWENGPQFGLYVTPSGWCAQSRGTYTEVKNKITAALVAAGIAAGTAAVISSMSAPIVVGALAL